MGQQLKVLRKLRFTTIAVAIVVAAYLTGVYGYFYAQGHAFLIRMASAYVTINHGDTDRFLDDLGSIAKSLGLNPWRGSAILDNGRTTYIFEVSGSALKIYAVNVLLSGHECVDYPGIGSDPGQFEFHVLPAVWLPLRDRATSLFKLISKDLSSQGYRVSSQPSTPCDPDRHVARLTIGSSDRGG